MDPGTIISIVETTYTVSKFLYETAQELKNAPNSLALVTIETERLHFWMERLQVMQQMLPQDARKFLDKQVSTSDFRSTIGKLVNLTIKIQPDDKMDVAGRLKWLWNKHKVEDLVSDLRTEIDRVSKLLTPEQLNQVVQTTNQVLGVVNDMDKKIDDKMERFLESVARLQLTQANKAHASPSFDQYGIYSPYNAVGIAWQSLANAAYRGDWDSVRRKLQHAETAYRQNWVNTTRIYEATASPSQQSGFTALHQAAHHGNRPAVEQLLRSGAWKLVRTYKASAGRKKHSTPLDVARNLDWENLYDLLKPVSHRTIRPKTLQLLQDHLHKLIREEFESDPGVHLDCFILPELEVLTEFERSRLWFPLNPELADTREGLAVHIVLDKDELVVSLRRGRTIKKNFRISEEGPKRIEQAIILS